MEGFREGYDFFESHAGNFEGLATGVQYVDAVDSEIAGLMDALNEFQTNGAKIDTLKGDVAEFWHAGTFNIKAAIRGSEHRAQVDRSHDFGSVDVRGKNFDGDFGLKYYKDGASSAKQQAKSIFERFKEYKSQGGKDELDAYLDKRGYSADAVLSDPVYSGQYRVIPSDQMKEATAWLERKIREEAVKRPEQVKRYEETLKLLRDKISDNEGNESIALSESEARELARLAKEGGVNPEELHLTPEELIQYTDILKQACKAGLTAATISMVLKVAPEIWNAVVYLIQNGEVDENQFKKIGFAAITGAGEGFVRGTVSAAITASCKAGLCGTAMKSIDPSVVGAVTVLVMNTMKNSYKVVKGDMTRTEMANELVKEMFVSTCALSLGAVGQSFIEIPVLGFMIGSFVGSLAGSVIYSAAYTPVMSFCVETGFTMFGLVDQNYELPDDVLKEIGVEVFEYDRFEIERFDASTFEFARMDVDRFEPVQLEITFLRRGVIGINSIGYVV